MGYIRHDAIVVTSWNPEAIEAAAEKAKEIGLYVLGPSAQVINSFRTLLICPDGSKEGWDDSNLGDAQRAQFLEYLDSVRYEDRSSCLTWVALAYGNDDGKAEITDSTWGVP